MRWLGAGIAIGVAIYVTGSMLPLWFLLIPAAIEIIDLATRELP